jgi:hypothetical protein
MKKHCIRLSVCLIALLMNSCGKVPKGACVREMGISSTCGDDFNSNECAIVSGTWYEGRTCASLGFTRN